MSQEIEKILDQLIMQNIDIELSNKGLLKLHFGENTVISDATLKEVKKLKQEIIAYLINNKVQKRIHIPKIPNQESYPLSYTQKRIWILSQIEDNSISYNIPFQVYIDHSYNIGAFKKSIFSVIKKHDILRTVFKTNQEGDVSQYIIPNDKFNFDINQFDFEQVADRETEIQRFIATESLKKFDLENGPLIKAYLIHIEKKKKIFFFNIHHIISDGWSRQILSKEIHHFYHHYKNNSNELNSSLDIQYGDYAIWQQNQIQSGKLDDQKEYWLKKLSNQIPLLNFPTHKVRPKIATNNGAILTTYIDSTIAQNLKAFSHNNGGSLFMSIIAIWRILIYRYTSQNDCIIGTPVAGRNHHDLENQLGCYVNTLALRQTINPLDNFKKLFLETKNEILEAFQNQDYPFDKLVEELKIPRDLSRNPLFDIMITLQNNSENNTSNTPEEIIFDIQDHGYSPSKLDLDIDFVEVGNIISCSVIYNTDVFNKEFVYNLINHFKELLSQSLIEPDTEIGKINFLSSDDTHLLINGLNNTSAKYNLDETFIQIYQSFVNTIPKKIALITSKKKYSYKEIDNLSNQLANYIVTKNNIKKGDLIGVIINRDEWILISILTIFKLGAVYVPIDPEHPQEKTSYILNNLKCTFIIDSNFIKKFKNKYHDISEKFICKSVKKTDTAYIIHTSGSTGNPKAAMITHQGMMNHLKAMQQELQLDKHSIITQNASIVFDISIWQLINALIVGGTTSIYEQKTVLEPNTFIERIFTEKVTILQVVPSYLSIILELEKPSGLHKLKHLKYLLATGETLPKNLVIQWFMLYPNIPLVNAYGPAEAADDVTLHIMKSPPNSSQIPIGKTIPNMNIYIVDENMQLCPRGVIGEICVAGVGVGNGYFNDIEKTKLNFIKNPFNPKMPKLYKTGDIGYWSNKNTLEFLGRKDHQVKIRGHRIELGEIENALNNIPNIKEAIVVAKADHKNEMILVAYYVGNGKTDPTNIRQLLKKKIPMFMIPNYFIKKAFLPTTSNGKIDRYLLTSLQDYKKATKKTYQPPKNEIEKKIVEIWEKELGINKISTNDDFFELGGDSLLMIKVIILINKYFNLLLPMIIIFEYNNIHKLSNYIQYIMVMNNEDDINYELIDI